MQEVERVRPNQSVIHFKERWNKCVAVEYLYLFLIINNVHSSELKST